MAWTTGTASDHIDLLSKLATFLSTDAGLVAAGQQWTVLRNSALPLNDTVPSGRIGFTNTTNGLISDPWPSSAPYQNVRLKISGTLVAPTTGTYTFSFIVDDMAELWIDGALVYGVYTPTSPTSAWPTGVTTTLSAGNHTIEVRYIGFAGSYSTIGLGWKRPGDSSVSLIPAASYTGLTMSYNSFYGSTTGNSNSAAAFSECFRIPDLILRGPGLSAADQIFVAINGYTDYTADIYSLPIRGLTGYNSTLLLSAQLGQQSAPPAMPVWNQPMKYWFIANGRRFIVIAKVSTTYHSMYGGFLLPYGLPTEIPYPLVIGASCNQSTFRWSSSTTGNSSFWQPGSNSATLAPLQYRNVSGVWELFSNDTDSSQPSGRTSPGHRLLSFRPDPTGNYALQPVSLFNTDYGGNAHGELDGVYSVSGYANASENIVTISGQDYLVVQSATRTTTTDYAAIKLQ